MDLKDNMMMSQKFMDLTEVKVDEVLEKNVIVVIFKC